MKSKQKYVYCAIFLSIASIVGFLENLIPVPIITNVPGIKLGFANIATVAVCEILGKKYASFVAILRPFVVFCFSGNAFSFALSLSGAVLSLLGVVVFYSLTRKQIISFVGLSAISATLHIIGQLLCAGFIMKTFEILSYVHIFIILSCVCGVLCGLVMNMAVPAFKKVIGKEGAFFGI